MQIENFSRRDRIRLRATLGLRYETTPDQLRYLLVELKKLLLGHPKVHPEPARVRFVGFGAYSLDIEVFAYVRTVETTTNRRHRRPARDFRVRGVPSGAVRRGL